MIPSWYHTLPFRQYPGYCTDGISARNQTLHQTIELRSSSPPRSSRSGAMSSFNSQRRLSKSEVTIDCYSEKRSRPSPWSGSALTGTRALGGPPAEYKRQDKNRFFEPEIWAIPTCARRSRARIDPFAFNSLAAWERKRIRFNGNIYTVRFISTTEHRITRATLERARAMNELLNWRLSFRFCFRLYTKLKHDHNSTTIHDLNLHQ